MGRAFVNTRARVIAAQITGDSDALDHAAVAIKMAVRFAAASNVDTGNYIRELSIVKVPGESGTGRGVMDRLVVANDPGAAAIEWGHLVRVEGSRRVKWVPGQHPMGRGLASLETVT